MDMNFDNNIPIFIQLLDYIKTDIVAGKYKKGEKLPSVREFASIFRVNPNTVQKALAELEESKLIYTDSTNGKYVTDSDKVIEKVRKEYATKVADEYFNNMKKIGLVKEDAISFLLEDKK